MKNDTDDALARPATLCAFCPKMCRSACPVSEAEKRETVTPWAKMSLVHLGRTGQVDRGDPGVQRALQACTGCGACTEQCAHGNPVTETLFAARALAPTSRAAAWATAFSATGDVKGRDHGAAVAGLKRDRSASVAYFPGCVRSAHDGRVSIEKDLRALARAYGHEVAVTEHHVTAQCCGYPVYADGRFDLVEENFHRLASVFGEHDLVVTPDPGCAYLLTTVRRKLLGGDAASSRFPEVLPLIEALAARAPKFTGSADGVVVRYHDPCYLARRGRSFDAPRRLLEAATGRPPLEFVRHHDEADCAGGGGLYPVNEPRASLAMAHRRATSDAAALDPCDLIVTACPSARRNFARAGIVARDVVDIILGE
jgi:Fe-S oxidoreductase